MEIKKSLTPSVFIITGLLIILAFFGYTKIIKPFYQNNVAQNIQINLTEDQNLELIKYPNQKSIYGIEIEITGNSDSNLELAIANPESTISNAIIKKGYIDFVYKSDWYSDTCLLNIHSLEKNNGKLKVEYRFLGMK